jgi:hypothetical protein
MPECVCNNQEMILNGSITQWSEDEPGVLIKYEVYYCPKCGREEYLDVGEVGPDED